jgi:hypothetical protein
MGIGTYSIFASNNHPFSVWAKSSGDVFYSDPQNHRIYQCPGSAAIGSGTLATCNLFAGTGTGGYNSDGLNGYEVQLNRPHGIYGDSNYLYICDTINFAIRRVAFVSTNAVTTIGIAYSFFFILFSNCLFLAGVPTVQGYDGDGAVATQAHLFSPFAIFVDSAGNKYFTDLHACTVRKIDATTGFISTILGIPHQCDNNGLTGAGTTLKLNKPYGITGDNGNSLYIADAANNLIREYSVSSQTVVRSLTGTSFTGDNVGFNFPTAVNYYSNGVGYLLIGENRRSTIRRLNLDTNLAVNAGATQVRTLFGTTPAPISFNRVKNMFCLASASRIFIADSLNHRIIALYHFSDPSTSLRRRLSTLPSSLTMMSTAAATVSSLFLGSTISSSNSFSCFAGFLFIGFFIVFLFVYKTMKKNVFIVKKQQKPSVEII